MRLLSAELTNFCQFRYLQVGFAPGLTMVSGRNGSGKSNLMKAIYATVTGDFGRNDGVKTDNICQFVNSSAPCKTHISLEHANTVLEISRSIRPTSTKLIIRAPGANETIITKAAEVNDAVIGILGVSSRMLADYVFVDQWSIFDFLSMMPAERAKAFQRLFRTERSESLWKIIGEHHDKIIIPTPGIDKDTVIKRLTENRKKIDDLQQNLEQSGPQVSAEAAEKERGIIWSFKRKLELDIDIGQIETAISGLNTELSGLQESYDAYIADLSVFNEYLVYARSTYIQAKRILDMWETYEIVEQSRSDLSEQLFLLEMAERVLAVPVKPNPYVGSESDPEYAQWWKAHNEVQDNVWSAQQFVDALNSKVPYCPTCGTPRDDLEKHREDHEKKLIASEARLKENESIRINSETYRSARRAYEAKKADLLQRIEDTTRQLKQIASIIKPEEDKSTLEAQASHYEQFATAAKQTTEELNQLEVKMNNRLGKLGVLQENLAKKLEEYDPLRLVTEEGAKNAEKYLQFYNEQRDKNSEFEATIAVTQRSVDDDEASLVQLEKLEESADAERDWSEYCLSMRHVVHRDSLPKVVAQNYLELMQDQINELLIRFDSPFKVAADDTLSFIAEFKDGRKVPASRLSGGEKVVLALAFRVAVNDLFARDLGILCLDEPTAGLDDGNLSCLKIAITKLKELSSSRGLQVIMVTHEKDLAYLFDHKIEIGI